MSQDSHVLEGIVSQKPESSGRSLRFLAREFRTAGLNGFSQRVSEPSTGKPGIRLSLVVLDVR
jgi:hypothetical protein